MALLAPTVPLVASLSIVSSLAGPVSCVKKHGMGLCGDMGVAIELRALKPINCYPNRQKAVSAFRGRPR